MHSVKAMQIFFIGGNLDELHQKGKKRDRR